MKIAELKSHLENQSEEQLKLLVTEIYKAIPKAIRESKEIDAIIKNPDKYVESRKKSAKSEQIPDIDLLRFDTETFLEYAQNQYYFAPNRFVSKKERPKWRFIVKRLYKELILCSQDESNLQIAEGLLEKLYNLMCYSCSYVIFNSYDSFESVGIEQKDFFNGVLLLKYQVEPKREFIKDALKLMIYNSLNRYTLHSTLIEVILSYLKTTDLLEMAIEENDKLMQIEKGKPVSKARQDYSQYDKEENLNNLAEFGFYCYVKLYEMDKAIEYFKRNYFETDREIKLYVLLRLLFSVNQRDLYIREYESAIKNGIKPRDRLVKMYEFTKESDHLPEYFG